MTALVVLAICAVVVLVLFLPFRTSGTSAGTSPSLPETPVEDEKERVFQALAELRFDYEAGKISREDFEAEDAQLRSRAAALLAELDRPPG